ncbi:MAG TPA: hypothetical protein VH413_20065 [Verrucomicrobiae bacterium]|jgi:hypothetical protein|nr:hypothetical protein [Verrucomicrobiae bacterium]
MKTPKILFTGAALMTFVISAGAEIPATIITTDGVTYNGVSLIRVEPDGYLVNYEPIRNGIGVAKIKFSRLSVDQQKAAGYDPQKAREYENGAAKASEDWRLENARMEQAAKAEMQSRDERDARDAQMEIQRLAALAQLDEAEANLARVQTGGESGGNDQGYGWTDGGGAIAIPTIDEGRNRFHDGLHHGELGHDKFNREHDVNHQLLSPWPPRIEPPHRFSAR